MGRRARRAGVNDPTARVPDRRLSGDLPVVDAATAAREVPERATVLVSGFGRAGYPKATPAALASAERECSLTVVSGGSVGDEIDGDLVAAGRLARRHPFVAAGPVREAIDDGRVAFHDAHVSDVADDAATGAYGHPDVAVIEAVAAGEGWLIPTASVGATPAFVRAADRLVVEVNEAHPLALAALHDTHTRALPPERGPLPVETPGDRVGGPRVAFPPEKLAAVVRTDRPDDPYEFRDPTATDEAVAANLADFLADEVERNPVFADRLRLQFGVGSLGNALMGAFRDVDLGRPVAYFGEVIQDGLLDMLDAGALTAASATSLALSRAGRERLYEDPARYADRLVVRSADVSNAAELIDRFGVVAVNSALEVDLSGHANATHLRGTDVVSGIGGGGDFLRPSALGVVALGSTAAGGDVSRIVPHAPHVDHTAHDFSVVVTDHGVADLRGLGGRERARALIEVADPSFRPELRAYHERALAGGGAIPVDHETAFDRYVE